MSPRHLPFCLQPDSHHTLYILPLKCLPIHFPPSLPWLRLSHPPSTPWRGSFQHTHHTLPILTHSSSLNVAHKVLAWAASDSWILHGAHGGTSSKPSPGESQPATPLCACTPSETNTNREDHTIMGTQHFYIQ